MQSNYVYTRDTTGFGCQPRAVVIACLRDGGLPKVFSRKDHLALLCHCAAIQQNFRSQHIFLSYAKNMHTVARKESLLCLCQKHLVLLMLVVQTNACRLVNLVDCTGAGGHQRFGARLPGRAPGRGVRAAARAFPGRGRGRRQRGRAAAGAQRALAARPGLPAPAAAAQGANRRSKHAYFLVSDWTLGICARQRPRSAAGAQRAYPALLPCPTLCCLCRPVRPRLPQVNLGLFCSEHADVVLGKLCYGVLHLTQCRT